MQLTNWQWHCTSHLLRHFCSLYFLLSRLYIFLDKKGKSLQEWSRCVQFLFCFFFIFFESKRFKLNSRRMISFQLGNSKSTTVLYGDANHFVLFTVPHFTSSAIWFYRRWRHDRRFMFFLSKRIGYLSHQQGFSPVEDYKRGIRLSVSVSRQLIAISKQIIGAANLNVAPTTQQASLVTIYIVSTETRVRARRSLSLSACGTSSSRARRVALRIISLRHWNGATRLVFLFCIFLTTTTSLSVSAYRNVFYTIYVLFMIYRIFL